MNETMAFRNGDDCYFMNATCRLVIHAEWIGKARQNEFKKFVRFVDYILMESYDDHQAAYRIITQVLTEYRHVNKNHPKLVKYLVERSAKYGL